MYNVKQALHHVDPFQIMRNFQHEDHITTFGHIVAHSGKVNLFKVRRLYISSTVCHMLVITQADYILY